MVESARGFSINRKKEASSSYPVRRITDEKDQTTLIAVALGHLRIHEPMAYADEAY